VFVKAFHPKFNARFRRLAGILKTRLIALEILGALETAHDLRNLFFKLFVEDY